MTTVGAFDAKTHLSTLLQRVEAGETITITRHGRAIARLVPAEPRPHPPDQVIAALRAARHGVRRGTLSIRDMIDEGRP